MNLFAQTWHCTNAEARLVGTFSPRVNQKYAQEKNEGLIFFFLIYNN